MCTCLGSTPQRAQYHGVHSTGNGESVHRTDIHITADCLFIWRPEFMNYVSVCEERGGEGGGGCRGLLV